jgi:phosphoribosylamine--glycine ligase
MRKYILVTETFDGLGFCFDKRLEDSEVVIAYQYLPKDNKDLGEEEEGYLNNGGGMVKKYPLAKLMAKREKLKDWYWIWDLNCNCEESEILREEGFKVFGGSQFTYDLENDRGFGIKFAESCGLKSPEYKEFSSIEEGISFLEQNEDNAYVYKPNHEDNAYTTVPISEEPDKANIEIRRLIKSLGFTDYILQERVNGVEVNVESFYVKGKCVFTWANLENKKVANGEMGVASGCSFDLGWQIDDNCELAEMTVRKFDDKLAEMEYTGFGDANVIISDYNEVNFLEFCFRSGYNSHPNLFINLASKSFLETCADMIDGKFETEFKKGFGASLTIFTDKHKEGLPVYIPESLRDKTYLFFVMKDEEGDEDDICISGYSKEICISTAHNYDIKSSLESVICNAEKIKFSNRYFRTDLADDKVTNSPISRYAGLVSMGLL